MGILIDSLTDYYLIFRSRLVKNMVWFYLDWFKTNYKEICYSCECKEAEHKLFSIIKNVQEMRNGNQGLRCVAQVILQRFKARITRKNWRCNEFWINSWFTNTWASAYFDVNREKWKRVDILGLLANVNIFSSIVNTHI